MRIPYKKIRILSVFVLISVVLGMTSCAIITRSMAGDKNVLERTYKLDEDNYTLEISGVEFTSGGVEKFIAIDESLDDSLKILTDENIFESLNIEIDHDLKILKITGDQKNNYKPSEFTITIGVLLSKIVINGEFSVSALIGKVKELELNIMGKADCLFVLDRMTAVSLKAGDKSLTELEGAAERLKIDAGGAAVIKAEKFKASIADIKLTASAEATIFAENELYAEADGSSTIRYSGEPQIKRQSITGIGELIKID